MKKLNFICPKCKGTTVEEVTGIDGVIGSKINGVLEDGSFIYGPDTEPYGDTCFIAYQCSSCGYVITNDEDGLLEAIENLRKDRSNHVERKFKLEYVTLKKI